ncbi:MAG TPA: sugar kinase [Nocardioidaceae bacterium]|nr:sugar kinase [Nocardioidaceae bacterium]
MTTRVQAVGECMVEIVRNRDGRVLLGYGGDAYNTAVYVVRVAEQLRSPVAVSFLTGSGIDEESSLMRASWQQERVEDHSVPVPDGAPGAYLVTTDDDGERSFSYWRNGSAAARLFQRLDWVERLEGDYVYLSGVTLQLMTDETRQALVFRLHELRADGTVVAFDSNYRAAGWRSPGLARAAMAAVLAETDIALVTLEDELALRTCTGVPSCLQRLADLGVPEAVVKVGSEGVWLGGPTLVATQPVPALDTTGAGDSFNGAYLAARIAGLPPVEAAAIGNQVAGRVVTLPGAVVDLGAMPLLVR